MFPAVQAAKKAVELAPHWWVAHQTLGRAFLGLGEVRLVSLHNILSIIYEPNYSKTSMAQTLKAYSLGLARTITMVPTGNFMHNLPWMAGTTLG